MLLLFRIYRHNFCTVKIRKSLLHDQDGDIFLKKVPMITERSWHDSRASKCTVGPVQGPSQGHGMLCLKTEKIQHAAYRHMKPGLTSLGGSQAVRLGFEMYTRTQTTAVRVCLQYSFSLTLKTTIHKTLILMRSLGAELEEELMTGWGMGVLSITICIKAFLWRDGCG